MRIAPLAALALLASVLAAPAVAADPLGEAMGEAERVAGCLGDAGPVGCVLGVEPDPVWCLVNQLRGGHPCR